LSRLAIVSAFVRRDFRIDISYRASFAIELLAIFFALALFFYLSRVVNESEVAGQDLRGGYFAFAAVGLALLQIMRVSMSSYGYKLSEEQTTGTFEELMATQASSSLIVLSSAVYDLLRATASGLVLIVAAMTVFGLGLDVTPGSVGTAVLALVGCLALFASLGVAVAAFTVVFKRPNAPLGMVVQALALLGGVYFPLDVLPSAIEGVAQAIPFTWGVDVFRASLLGGDVDPLQLAGLLASAALLLPIALVVFSAAVTRARRTGTLAQY
jgi:ABC-2 type transport system permease protein